MLHRSTSGVASAAMANGHLANARSQVVERSWLETIQSLGLDVQTGNRPVAVRARRTGDAGPTSRRVARRLVPPGPQPPGSRPTARRFRGLAAGVLAREWWPGGLTRRSRSGGGLAHDCDPLVELRDALRAFAAERDWDQFHSPRNLAAALAVEAAELLEPFQWLTDEQSRELSADARAAVGAGDGGRAALPGAAGRQARRSTSSRRRAPRSR